MEIEIKLTSHFVLWPFYDDLPSRASSYFAARGCVGPLIDVDTSGVFNQHYNCAVGSPNDSNVARKHSAMFHAHATIRNGEAGKRILPKTNPFGII